jgi:hypothetical protein
MEHKIFYRKFIRHCEWDVFRVSINRTERIIIDCAQDLLEMSVRNHTPMLGFSVQLWIGRHKTNTNTAQILSLLSQVVGME